LREWRAISYDLFEGNIRGLLKVVVKFSGVFEELIVTLGSDEKVNGISILVLYFAILLINKILIFYY
jgi:hypothetical protein